MPKQTTVHVPCTTADLVLIDEVALPEERFTTPGPREGTVNRSAVVRHLVREAARQRQRANEEGGEP